MGLGPYRFCPARSLTGSAVLTFFLQIFMPFKIVYAARSSVGAIRKLWE